MIHGGFDKRKKVLANDVKENACLRVEKSQEIFWQFFKFLAAKKKMTTVFVPNIGAKNNAVKFYELECITRGFRASGAKLLAK